MSRYAKGQSDGGFGALGGRKGSDSSFGYVNSLLPSHISVDSEQL